MAWLCCMLGCSYVNIYTIAVTHFLIALCYYYYLAFVYIVTADSKPSIKMLQRHVIPYVATKWYELGAELFDEGEEYKLDTIESSHKNDVNKCCHEMFRMWLKTTNITWSQIPEALKSPGVDLESVAAELEKDLIGKCNNHLSG